MVIATDDITERGQALFYTLDLHIIGQCVSQVLQFLVCCCCGDKESLAVSAQVVHQYMYMWEYWFVLEKRPTHPAVKRPMMRVPAIVAWQIGMTS